MPFAKVKSFHNLLEDHAHDWVVLEKEPLSGCTGAALKTAVQVGRLQCSTTSPTRHLQLWKWCRRRAGHRNHCDYLYPPARKLSNGKSWKLKLKDFRFGFWFGGVSFRGQGVQVHLVSKVFFLVWVQDLQGWAMEWSVASISRKASHGCVYSLVSVPLSRFVSTTHKGVVA